MRGAFAVLAAAAAVIIASPFPQGVTEQIAPSGTAPAGCFPNHPGYFGVAVHPIGSKKDLQHILNRREARPQVVTSINDGQLQAPSGSPTMNLGPPVPATVSPPGPSSPASNGPSFATPAGPSASMPAGPSGSIPAGPSGSISAGPSGSTPAGPTTPMPGVFSFSSTTTVTLTRTVTIKCTSSTTVSIITSTMTFKFEGPSSTLSTVPTTKPRNTQTSSAGASTTMIPVSQIPDGQIQATNTTPPPKPDPSTVHVDPITSIPDGQIQAPPASRTMLPRHVLEISEEGSLAFDVDAAKPTPVACETNNTLSMHLRHGVLTDRHGRTGYIASNFQFQFDGPPQSQAIYTAGFSLCNNGSLALGGSTVFWQCLSGNFYNLYDRYWAPQCEPIELIMVKLLKEC